MARYAGAMQFVQPAQPHTLTPQAKAAVAAHRRVAESDRLRRLGATIVSKHGHPAAWGGVRLTAAAKRIARSAEAAGWLVLVRETANGCVVEGHHLKRRVGFRAYWLRGKTAGATWHEGTRDVWKVIDISARPIGKDATAKTTKLKHRHDENDRTRIVLASSPHGVAINVTTLEERI